MKKIIITCAFLMLITGIFAQTTFNAGGLIYTITSSNTVEVSSSFTIPCADNIIIPSTVIYSSVNYTVTSIKVFAFLNCSNLASIAIPNSVNAIGPRAFDGTNWYKSQPDGLVYAGKVAYAYKGTMPANTSINLNEGTTGIAEGIFEGCLNLTSINIPSTVTSIGGGAFANCSNLTFIIIPSSVNSIGACAFLGTAWYDSQPDGLVYAGKVVYTYKGTMPGNSAIILNEGTTGIADDAFYYCRGLNFIGIPNSVISIGGGAFELCDSLTSISIPSSVISIGGSAFCNCHGLISISIPSSVTCIGGCSFAACIGLTSVSVLGSPLIGRGAFRECPSIKSIYVYQTVPADLSNSPLVFYNGVNQSTCNFYVPKGSKVLYQAAAQWKDFSNIVEFDATAVNNPKNPNLKIFYNQATGSLQLNDVDTSASISVYDLNGRLCLNRTIMANEAINLKSIPRGLYMIKAVLNNEVVTQKIVL